KPSPATDVVDALDSLATVTNSGRKAVSVFLGAQRWPTERAVITLAWEVPPGGATDALDAVDHVSVVASAVTGEEVFRGAIPRDPAGLRPGGVVTFTAPAGAVRVKITAENARGLRVDTSDASVDVPDFTATGPQLTTPFIYRGRTARDIQ